MFCFTYIDFYYSKYIQYKDTLDAWIFFCVTWFDEFRLRMETKKHYYTGGHELP